MTPARVNIPPGIPTPNAILSVVESPVGLDSDGGEDPEIVEPGELEVVVAAVSAIGEYTTMNLLIYFFLAFPYQ